MLGRHPPVFAPSPGSGSAVRGVASVVAPLRVRHGGLLATESSCRGCWSAMVSGPSSLLTAAASSSDMLVSRVPVLSAVSIGQSSLVSRLSEASGAVSRLEALVSRSPAPPATAVRPASPAGDAPVSLHSIPLLPRPYHASSVSLAPSYLWTLVLRLGYLAAKPGTLRGRQASLPCFETCDQSALKRLTTAFEAPLLSPPSGML